MGLAPVAFCSIVTLIERDGRTDASRAALLRPKVLARTLAA